MHVTLKNNENFVILPPRVWRAFTSWYGNTITIRRKVICMPNKEKKKQVNSGKAFLMKLNVYSDWEQLGKIITKRLGYIDA